MYLVRAGSRSNDLLIQNTIDVLLNAAVIKAFVLRNQMVKISKEGIALKTRSTCFFTRQHILFWYSDPVVWLAQNLRR